MSGAVVVVVSGVTDDPLDSWVDDGLDELSQAAATRATAMMKIAIARRGVKNPGMPAGYR